MATLQSSLPPQISRGFLRRITDAGPWIAFASAFAALSIRFFLIAYRYSVDIFFLDHWQFEDATLFQKHSWLEIFRWQHGPHRQGLGGLFLAAFEPLIHWNQRYVAFGIAGIIACACLAALWLKSRIFGKIGFSDVVIPLLFFTPVQYETLLGANNPSHGPLPLLLVLLYCLAWTITDDRWKDGSVLTLNLLLIYTGFGLFMGFVTPVLLGLDFLRRRKRLTLVSLGVSIVSMGSFFIGYRLDPAAVCFSPEPRGDLHYVVYVAFMFSAFVKVYPTQATVVPAILTGSLVLLIVVATAVNVFLKLLGQGTVSIKPLAASVLLGYSLIFCAATAYGRTCLGIAPAPRYMTYLILAFYGLYLAALSARHSLERKEFIGVVLLLSILSSGWIGPLEEREMSVRLQQRRTWKKCYLSNRSVEECDARSGPFIDWKPEPADLKPKLDFLERHRLGLFY